MAKNLVPLNINAPGALGLNKKHARLDIGSQWCTQAQNAIVSASGTLAARKGWKPKNGTAITGTPNVKSIFEYVDSQGTGRMISSAGNKLWEGTGTLTDVTGTLTPTADNWKFVNFNNKVIGVQAAHAPIAKSGTGNFAAINFNGGSINNPYEALSAWGRVWYVNADGKTILWSDLLIEGAVTGSTSPGSSGQLNLATVWGGDRIVALAAFKDYLVIFGKEHIVLYDGAEDPNNSLRLAEIIYGTGCIARDSVQSTGNDILFLGAEGVTSLARNIQDGSLPLTNLSENIRDYLATYTLDEQSEDIKSLYKPDEGAYLLSFPKNNKVFYFNFKFRTPEKLPRITEWEIDVTALHCSRDSTVYIGKPGHLGYLTGYTDNGNSYEFSITTGWDTGGPEMAPLNKIPKQAYMTVSGGYATIVTLTWAFDYASNRDSGQAEVEQGIEPAKFGISRYGIGRYSGLSATSTIRFRLSGTGRAVQYTVRCTVKGSDFVLQRIDVYSKIGRVI